MQRFASYGFVVFVALAGCSKTTSSTSSTSSSSGSAATNLTVDAYCTPFCTKLCGTCGMGNCADTCKPRCQYGRAPDMVLDGKDPKVALARTQQNLDACLATITSESCAAIMGGQVPQACFTIQH